MHLNFIQYPPSDIANICRFSSVLFCWNEIVVKTRICIATFGNNLMNTLKDEFPIHLQLPADLHDNALILSFPKETYQTAINKKIFI